MDACSENDYCSGGSCQPGTAKDCDDDDICTDDSCDSGTGCVNANNSQPCNDGNPCTQSDVCSGGNCVGGELVFCDDGNPCTDGSCNTDTGACEFANNTAACDDGNACTVDDTCSAGECAGTDRPPGDCDDSNACTSDSCEPADGCVNTDISSTCVDGDPCTTDSCDAVGGCTYQTINSPACGAACVPSLVRESTNPIQQGRAPGYAVVVDGTRAYVGSEAGIEIYDVPDSSTITPRGVVETGVPVRGLAVSDGYVYAALSKSSASEGYLRIYDLSDPETPVQKGSETISGGEPQGLVVSGNRAYVAGNNMGVGAHDISDPTDPRAVGTALNSRYDYVDITVANGYLVLARSEYSTKEMAVATMADSPQQIDPTVPNRGSEFVDGSGPYVVTDDTVGGLSIYEVMTGGYTNLVSNIGGISAVDARFAGTLLVVSTAPAQTGDALRVYDVANLSNPSLVGEARTSGRLEAIDATSSVAWTAGAGFRSFTISTAVAPEEKEKHDYSGGARKIRVSGDYAYVADGPGGLRTVDVDTPDSPAMIHRIDPGGYPWDVALSGSYIYFVGDSLGFITASLADPAAPVITQTNTSVNGARAVDVSGNYAYAAGPNKLQIYDITAPTYAGSPAAKGSVEALTTGTDPDVSDIRVANGYAYIMTNEGLVMVDVSNPASPGQPTSPDYWAESLEIAGSTLYTLSIEGNEILDTSNAPTLMFLGRMMESQGGGYIGGQDLMVLHDFAYVTGSMRRFDVVDVSNPEEAYLKDSETIGADDQVYGLDIYGNRAYVAIGSIGPVEVVRIDCMQ